MTVNSIQTIAHDCVKSMAMNFMADGKDELVTSSFVSIVRLFGSLNHIRTSPKRLYLMNFMADGKDDLVTSAFVSIVRLFSRGSISTYG